MTRTCAYGSCEKPGDAVTMNIPSNQARPCFCSLLHAAMYLVWKLRFHASEATRDTASEIFRIEAEDALVSIERNRVAAEREQHHHGN
jgi:hypothetical protein